MDSACVPTRRRKTAKERREQRHRSEARTLQRVLQGLNGVSAHMGGQLTRIGGMLREAILLSRASPSADVVPLPAFAQRRTAAGDAAFSGCAPCTSVKRQRSDDDEGVGTLGGDLGSASVGGAQHFDLAEGDGDDQQPAVTAAVSDDCASSHSASVRGAMVPGRTGKGVAFRMPSRRLVERLERAMQTASSEEQDQMGEEWNEYLVRSRAGGKGQQLPSFLRHG